jgi:hypothetical protein
MWLLDWGQPIECRISTVSPLFHNWLPARLVQQEEDGYLIECNGIAWKADKNGDISIELEYQSKIIGEVRNVDNT